MRVFVTGATGFIGSAVTKELIAGGHEVLGMARSDEGAASLTLMGADVHRGTLSDIESLKSGAAAADAVIHLAFIHEFSTFVENCQVDKHAIEAMGSVLVGSKKPLIVTSGLAGLAGPDQATTEDMDVPPDFPFPRVSEQTAFGLKGVSAATMRLPQVHDTTKQGLVSYVIPVACEKGVSAYIDEGRNRWAAAHVSDVAKAYRLALEHHEPGAKWHAVTEEGISMRDIAEAISNGLTVPVKSVSPKDAEAHFGWLAMFVGQDLMGSSAKTRKKLGWNPTGPGLITDLTQMNYAKSA